MNFAKNSVRLILAFHLISCAGASTDTITLEAVSLPAQEKQEKQPVPAAERMADYLPLLVGKRVALVANHTSMVGRTHLVDTLLASGVEIAHVYAPEHGFRGDMDAGAHVHDEKDPRTGLSIYSLHGKTKKPSASSLEKVDMVVFDIQDVGARFYTYISTLHYVMEACAEQAVPLLVLDRPNPHAHYVDGPVLDPAYKSFVGMHPVPVVYGMTIGEYAQMIDGELWLAGGRHCELSVIPCADYRRDVEYVLPIAPSPNLPTQTSIRLYPSLCFFEGTVVSIGRGTDYPFEVVGHPDFALGSYSFTPQPNSGSKHPKLEGENCFGQHLGGGAARTVYERDGLDLSYLHRYHEFLKDKVEFFSAPDFFDKLAGTDRLRKDLVAGKEEKEIRASWQEELEQFKKIRERYLIYP